MSIRKSTHHLLFPLLSIAANKSDVLQSLMLYCEPGTCHISTEEKRILYKWGEDEGQVKGEIN